jgi:hypothetical protein
MNARLPTATQYDAEYYRDDEIPLPRKHVNRVEGWPLALAYPPVDAKARTKSSRRPNIFEAKLTTRAGETRPTLPLSTRRI